MSVAPPAGSPEHSPQPAMEQRRGYAPPPEIWPAGKVIADIYRIQRRLGYGGMGQVYLAMDEATHRPIAVKVPYDMQAGDPEQALAQWRNDPRARESLLAEVKRWMDLAHPHIVAAFDVVDDQRTDYVPAIFMDYCEAGSLDSHLRGPQRMDRSELLDVAIQVCWAMAYAHEKGLIHRDLKPANVLLTQTGVAKVSDFGLVKALGEAEGKTKPLASGQTVQVSTTSGTPVYMPPEQWQGRVAKASDVYAFGVMLYEMFTGQWPFVGDCQSLARMHTEAEPKAPAALVKGLPEGLNRLILHCLSKDPKARPRGFDALAEELTACYRQVSGKIYQRAKPTATELSREQRLQRGWALNRLGLGCKHRGDLKQAMDLFKQHEQICRELGDRDGLSASLGNQAMVFRAWGQLKEAMALLKQQEQIGQELGDHAGLSVSLGNQALILQTWGQLKEAMTLHKRVEQICRELGDHAGLAQSLGNQAVIHQDWGQLEKAMALRKEEEQIWRELGDRAGLLGSLGGQAAVLHAWGQLKEAMELLKQQEKICRELGDRAGLSRSLGNQALILEDWSQLREAMELLKQQEQIFRELGDRAGLSGNLNNQAVILKASGRLKEAMELLKQQEKICRELGDRAGLSASLGNQARVLRTWGQLKEAMALHKEEEQIDRELGDRAGLSASLNNQALILQAWGQSQEAMDLHMEVEQIFRELGDPNGTAISLVNQGSLLAFNLGQLQEGMRLVEEALRIAKGAGLAALAGQIDGMRTQIAEALDRR